MLPRSAPRNQQKESHMRRLVTLQSTLGLTLLLAACNGADTTAEPMAPASDVTAAVIAVHFVNPGTFAFDIENPCTGETVSFSGERFEQITAVGTQELLEQGQAFRCEDQASLSGIGTGTSSGTEYRIRDVIHFGIRSPSAEALNFTQVFNERIQAIAQGSADDFFIHVNFHVTVLPDGRIVTEFEQFDAVCVG